jgi:hypothetical protein
MKLQKKNDYYLVDNSGHTIATTDKVILKKIKSISKLSKENCDEIFGVINIIDLAERNSKHSEEDYIEGFNKAIELNKDKLFTVEDLYRAFLINSVGNNTTLRNFFEQTVLPMFEQLTEIEVEVKMEPCYYDQTLGAFSTSYTEDKPKEQPKLDKNGCLILKRHYISQNNKD